MSQPDTARLLIACDDQPGIVAAVAGVLAQHGANIISLDQHSTAPEDGTFVQRAIFHLPGLPAALDGLQERFGATVAQRFSMDYRFTEAAKPKREKKEYTPFPPAQQPRYSSCHTRTTRHDTHTHTHDTHDTTHDD